MCPEPSLAESVDNLVHGPTQVHDHGIDLTVSAIYKVTEPGRLDFGGDELEDAHLEPVPTTLSDSEDDYGWWDLSAGQYVIQHNEFVTDVEEPLLLQARNALLARGGSHPSLRVYDHLPLVPLSVGGGLEIKENARVSTLLPAATSTDGGREVDVV